MSKLVLSPRRYSAIMHASSILEGATVIVVSDGMEEESPYRFCWRAMQVQREFEIEKAYKIFGVRQLYMMKQHWYDIDYELLAVKLQLMVSVAPFKTLYFTHDGDQRLHTVCTAINGVEKKVYTHKPRRMWEVELGEETLGRKLDAIEKFVTCRQELLTMYDVHLEYIQR